MSGPASSARPTPLWAVALGGLATALAFPLQPLPDQPPISLWPLCFVGPAPFLARLLTADSVWSAAKTGLVFAMAWFLVAGCWVFRVFDVLGWVLIWLPIGWVVVFAVAAHVVRKAGFSPNWTWPILWIAVEFIRAEWTPLRLDWFSADLDALNFTWFGLGHPRLAVAWACQSAEFGGGYFLALLPMVLSMSLALFWHCGRLQWSMVLAPILLVAAEYFWYPTCDYMEHFGRRTKVSVGVVQSERYSARVLMDLTLELLAAHPATTLVVWPEESFTARSVDREMLAAFARSNRITLVAGVEELHADGSHRNVAWWLSRDGSSRTYFKKQRVPFVEHHPASRECPIFDCPTDSASVRVAVLICYDMDFAWNPRQAQAAGAQLFVMPALDDVTWGGTQHAQHALLPRLRAIENRSPIVEAATSGVSQIIDTFGEVRAEIPFRLAARPDRNPLYREGFAAAEVALTGRRSLYSFGGWLAGPAVAIAGMVLVVRSIIRLRRRR